MRDWLHLRPLTHALKTWRYRQINSRGLAKKPDSADVESVRNLIHGRRVIVVVAFNDDQAIRLQSALVERHMQNVLYLVVDNSSDTAAAARIKEHCRLKSLAYIRLESNPWTGKNASRSHGFAMNWTWRHLLLPGEPRQFGFIDHDLFPAPPLSQVADSSLAFKQVSDPFRHLDTRICYGDKRWAGDRWFLWAGFCFFDFAGVKKLPLDFGLDWFAGLDTGGANWDVLYQHIDPGSIPDRYIYQFSVWPDIPLKDAYFERRDDWIHEVGLDGRKELRSQKRLELLALFDSTCAQRQTGLAS